MLIVRGKMRQHLRNISLLRSHRPQGQATQASTSNSRTFNTKTTSTITSAPSILSA
jgi:hypothetical protein